jgi:hypothetical protein
MSKFLRLDYKDLAKGLLIAALTPALLVIQQSLSEGSLVLNWDNILAVALAGGLSYLIKNFFSGPKTTMMKRELENSDPQNPNYPTKKF